MDATQLDALAARQAQDIARTQQRNERARQSAVRRRYRELAAIGIEPDRYVLCDDCSL
jgi:regulator of protease activity HflC (stomatin/prohibitin superfamily)